MARAALVLFIAAVFAAGCGSSSYDRAGGTKPVKPTVLTMANVNYAPEELEPFASAVERVSGGRLRIRWANEWGKDRPGYGEATLIGDVQAGKADLGWVGTRAFDLVGAPAFGPLHAPMLIDSYALEQEVLSGDLVEPMLTSLDGIGLRGIGVLPGPLRRPLANRALLAPGDWSGARMGYQGGRQIERSLRELGAEPHPVPSGASTLAGLDGIEQHLSAIVGNRYQREAPYLTGNVVLWPRPYVVFAGRGVTAAHVEILREAAQAAAPAVLEAVRRNDHERLDVACRQGMQVATASAAAVSALRQAFGPVYADLERDNSARAAIAEIARMRQSLGVAPAAVRCDAKESRPTAAGIPDGTYEVTITPRDAVRAGLPPDDPFVLAGVTHNTLELHGGEFMLTNDTDPDGWQGTYSVYRDRVKVTGLDEEITFTARWSFDADRLRFNDITLGRDIELCGCGADKYETITWGSHPWLKVG